jgi:hypothetical protein
VRAFAVTDENELETAAQAHGAALPAQAS